MEPKRRFTLLIFPQFFDGTKLTLRLVVLPRNQNPLRAAIESDLVIPNAPAFADADLSFEAKIITGLGSFPNTAPTDSTPLTIVKPTQARELFTALGKNFDIDETTTTKADAARPIERSVKKYLPVSYRRAFNFTTPRTPNAVTDDSYHCAVRGAEYVPGFIRSRDQISWGKVFAYALRQPALARQLGMIYKSEFTIDAAHFPHGGWLYVDLADRSDYKDQQRADPNFIKLYAARIPALTLGAEHSRQLFAPLLFPVLAPGQPTDGNYDELLIEATSYDDGFAKIIHAHQPHSRNLLAEESDGAHPVKDAGIRLGWDDEQILIWYMRQLTTDDSVKINADGRIDAPLGVFGYAVDVRNTRDAVDAWESLNHVESRGDLTVPKDKNQPDDTLSLGRFKGELPYQVYPAQLDGDLTKNYWLPMYFANWNGRSMVLPDTDAARMYQTTNPDVQGDAGTHVTAGGAQNQLNDIYGAGDVQTKLRYGQEYAFRVRLRDLSGGGPRLDPTIKPINESPANTVVAHFKRYVAPNRLRIEDQNFNNDTPLSINQLDIRRPLLNYPAAVYAKGKYADPAQSLIDAAQAMIAFTAAKKGGEAFGIADPDVDRVEITVEVQALRMDNLLSVSGTENYVHLYTTQRFFPPVNVEDDYEAALNIPIVYKDCAVLHTAEDELDVRSDLRLPDNIDRLDEIVLPTARVVRLTMRAVCEDKEPRQPNSEYYGLLGNDKDLRHERDVRYGQIAQMTLYQASTDETALFIHATDGEKLRGIYLQPDPPSVFDGNVFTLLLGKEVARPPDMIQRLAQQLGLANSGLTLSAPKGERVQFGCSNRIRHTLSPDNSSITFAAKGDLMHHWLCCLTLTINRDWTWDALEDRSFIVTRTKLFTHDDPATETETGEVGDIEVKHTASFESLHEPQRNFTRLIFIDAVEPKNPRTRRDARLGVDVPRFPDTIEVDYTITPRLKAGHGAQHDRDEELPVRLAITTPPAQVPKIVSAGIALSPYHRNEKYSASDPRRRRLWIEFAEPILDPNDTYFARVLAIAPDQLISNNNSPELFIAPEEPALPIDPELIRVVTRGATNDLAGLAAMQPMEKATDGGRHYLLPLPPNIHADADEMFGFFTYEFCVGHYRESEVEEQPFVWSSAQGRYGRPLRATGIQHPAPTLTCTVNRDEEKLYVSAPYAVAVFDGKNVTADPPRTQLWCLLYAQVKQADNKDYRNILLDDRQLDWRVRVEDDKRADWLLKYDDGERRTLKGVAYRNAKDDLSYTQLNHLYKLAETDKTNRDATKQGVVIWSNDEIAQMLRLYGLPDSSSLSVLVVEALPGITKLSEHISVPGSQDADRRSSQTKRSIGVPALDNNLSKLRLAQRVEVSDYQQGPSPVSDALGHQRILRTSPLTEVPFVCCPTC